MCFEGNVLLMLVICAATVYSQQHNGFSRELPQFNKEPFNLTAFVGETTRLSCSVSHLAGNQAVAWMKLNPTSSFLTSGTQSFSSEPGKLSVVGEHKEGNLQFDLLINNVTEKDAGEYICTVVEFGELNYRRWRRSQKATVTVIKPTPKPTLKCIADPHAGHLHSGVHLRVGCKLDGAGPRDTRISMNWTRNEDMVVSRTRFEGIQFGEGLKPSPELLHVFKVTTRDQGDVYTCSVEYDHHNGTRWITVQDQCHLTPLHVKPYSNLILSKRAVAAVDVGQEVRFVCPARTQKTGEPRLRAFTWNIVPTISPSRFRLSHHGDELIIHRILPEDHGLKVSCFIPPLTVGTSKRELYLRVRHPDTDLLWEPRSPEVVPFGPATLVDSLTSSKENNSRALNNQSTTNSPSTVTTIVGLNDSPTIDSGPPRAYPMYSAGNTEFLMTPDTNQTKTNETNEPAARVGNLTINFQLIPPLVVTEPSNILSPLSSSSSSSPSSSSSSSASSRSHIEGGTGDTDGTGDTEVVTEGGDPFVDNPSYHDYHYDIDLIGRNINRTAIAPSDLSSSDFIFIFVMIAEVILTVLLVVLLLVTGPVCFASKRNKDQDDTNDTDVEKAAPPMPMIIAPTKETSSTSHGNEVAILPREVDSMTSEKGNSAPRLTKKEVPTVDITLSFEVKGQRRDDGMEKRSVPTVSESVKDQQGSDASTVEFTTFGYPRSETSSEA